MKPTQETREMSVDEMTSREFQKDTHAHIEFAAQTLKDETCIRYFQNVIYLNKHLFRGKTVLNIGCGTGILSLFSARAGAARVFAVDSSNVVEYTRKIVAANNYSNVIKVIKGRIEQICLPVNQVDIIVCDWMGYSLFYQCTCQAVIYARDKWLRRGSGLIFPDHAKLFIAGFEDSVRKNDKIEWWKNVYGFNMKCLRELALKEPCFYEVEPDQVITSDFNVKTLNLYTAKSCDLGLRSMYSLRMTRGGWIDGVVTYFQIRFSKSHTPFMFGTDPWSAQTHWMQTVFFFDQPVSVRENEVLCGGFQMAPVDRMRPDWNNVDVALELCCRDSVQIVVDMHWVMKPHVSIVEASDAGIPSSLLPARKGAEIDANENAVDSPFLKAILRISEKALRPQQEAATDIDEYVFYKK